MTQFLAYVTGLLLFLLSATPVVGACNPNAATGTTARLGLTTPGATACSMISPFLTFAGQVDTRMAAINYANNYSVKQTFAQGIRITPGASAGLCLVSDASGNASWGSCSGTGGSGLPADPTACTANQFVTDQNASGVLTCSAVNAAALAAGFVDATTDLATGLCTDGQFLTKSGGAWTCSGTTVDALTDLSSSLCTTSQVLKRTAGGWECTPTVSAANQLAAEPTGCTGSQVAYGVTTNGNAYCKTLGFADLSGEATVAQLPNYFDSCSDCSSNFAASSHLHTGDDISSAVTLARSLDNDTCLNGEYLKKINGSWACTSAPTGGGGTTTNPPECVTVEDVVAGDDDYEFFIASEPTTIYKVGCRCRGTCTTPATFRLEDRAGNTMTGIPTCSTGTGDTTYTDVTSSNILSTGDGLAFDVTNTPTTGDVYTLCVGHNAITPHPPVCRTIPDINANDDNYELWMPTVNSMISSVACRCRGTCTTPATFRLEDRGGNIMTGTPTCATVGNSAFTSITAGGSLSSGEGLAFDVTNTPTTGDVYTLCFTYSEL